MTLFLWITHSYVVYLCVQVFFTYSQNFFCSHVAEKQYPYLRPIRQSFKHRSSLSGMPLPLFVRKQSRMKIFKTSCRMNTTFSSKPNVGVIAICRRNGTSSYRNARWEKVVRENVWKDSLFKTPRRICGTGKTPY